VKVNDYGMPPADNRLPSSVLNEQPWRQSSWLAVGVAALLFGLALFVPWQPLMPTEGRELSSNLALLEPSWKNALNESFARGMRFGEQIVFTFGPWGFLFTKMYHPSTFPLLIAAWAFMGSMLVVTGFQIARRLTLNPFGRFLWFLGIIEIAAVSPDVFFLSLCLLFLMYGLYVHDGSLSATYVLLCLTLGLISLVKFTVLILAVTLVAVVALFDLLVRKRFPWTAMLYPVAVIGFWTAAGQHLGDLSSYFSSSLWIARGYTDAMALAEGPGYDVGIFLVLSLLALTWVLASQWRKPLLTRTLSVGGLSLVLFMGFKAGFVRQDPWHGLTAPFTLLAATWSYAGVSWAAVPWRGAKIWLAVLVAGTLMFGWISLERYAHLSLPRFLERTAQFAVSNTLRMMETLVHGDVHLQRGYGAANARIRSAFPLPAITGSVDVYPYEQAVLFAHDVQWNPRPVFQSYSAYSPELAQLNAAHLRGSSRPDWVLFALGPIDGRYPAFDDSLSWPELLTRYDVQKSAGPFLLLKRAARERAFRLVPLREFTAQFGAPVTLTNMEAIWACIEVQPTWLGRLLAMLYKPPPIFLDVKTLARPTERYRLIPGITRAGFLLSPLIDDRQSFEAFASLHWRQDLEGRLVRGMMISTEPAAQFLFQRDIRVTLSVLDFPRQPQEAGLLLDGTRKAEFLRGNPGHAQEQESMAES
jgi:hypothetical protein